MRTVTFPVAVVGNSAVPHGLDGVRTILVGGDANTTDAEMMLRALKRLPSVPHIFALRDTHWPTAVLRQATLDDAHDHASKAGVDALRFVGAAETELHALGLGPEATADPSSGRVAGEPGQLWGLHGPRLRPRPRL